MRQLIIIIFFALSVVGCSARNSDKMQFSGTLELTEHQLGFKSPGRLATLTVEEGDMVKAGQMIATLDRYEQMKKDYERAQALLAAGGADDQSVEYARLNMEDQSVIAPIDGVVLVKVHEVGEMVGASSPVVVIGNMNELWVKIFVPEGRVNRLHMYRRAELTFDGLSKSYQGYVSYIAPKAEFTPRNVQTTEERVTQGFAVKVTVAAPDLQAHPGVAVDVQFDK